MALPTVSLGGETLPLFTGFKDERSRPYKLRPAMRTATVTALNRRQSRRPRRLCPQWGASVHYNTHDEALADFRSLLGTDAGRARVLFPLWPLQTQVAGWAERLVDAQLLYNLTTGALITNGSVAGLSASDWVVPIVLGRIDRPRLEGSSRTRAVWTLAFTEWDSPWDYRCDIFMDGTASGASFPEAIAPNWNKAVIDTSDDALEFTELGSGRLGLTEGQEAPYRWAQEASFDLPREHLRRLLRHWRAQLGARHSFIVPVWTRPHDVQSAATPNSITATYAADELALAFRQNSRAEVEKLGFVQAPWELAGNEPADDDFTPPPEAYLYTTTVHVPHFAAGPLVRYETDWERPLVVNGQVYQPAPMEWTEYEEGALLTSEAAEVIAALHDETHPFNRLYQGEIDVPVEHRVERVDPTAVNPTPERLFEEVISRPVLTDREFAVQVGGLAPPKVPKLSTAREAVNHVPETYLIRSGVMGSGGAIAWDDERWQGNPVSGRYDGWIAENLATGGRQTITTHTRTTTGATLSGLVGGDFAAGAHVIVWSAYGRRGTIVRVIEGAWMGNAQYLITFDDGGGRPVGGYLERGPLYIGQGEAYQERLVFKHWTATGDQFTGADAAVAFDEDLRGTIAAGTRVYLFPGWDGTHTQIKARFPAAEDYAIFFPHIPLVKIDQEDDNPYEPTETGGKGGK